MSTPGLITGAENATGLSPLHSGVDLVSAPERASADFTTDPIWEWTSAAHDSGEDLRALWAQRVEASRAVLAGQLDAGGADALAATYPAWGGRSHPSLRWVLVHMIEEYARHNGHADLLRESIDGQTGE